MVRWSGLRAIVRVAAIVAAAAGILADTSAFARASAKSRTRPTDDVTASLRSPILDMTFAVRAPTRAEPFDPIAGARFFTINQILARRGEPRLAAAANDNTASDASVAAPTLAVASDEPFGLSLFRAPDGILWRKWTALSSRLSADAQTLTRCRAEPDTCSSAATRFLAITSAAKAEGGRARIATVNHRINAAVRYADDLSRHGTADHWSAPLETFTDGRGDCEDYAVAKLVALREAGMDAADLRLLLVRDLVSRQDHAVLAARHDGRWLVLDNRWDGLAEAGALPRLLPLFAIDSDGVKLFAAPFAKRAPHESETDIVPAGDAASIGGSTVTLAL